MANRYSKSNYVQDKDNKQKEQQSGTSSGMKEYDERRKKLNTTAKWMAIIVAIAMIVTTFLASGVFFFD